MTKLRLAVLTLSAPTLLVACQLLVGIDEDRFTVLTAPPAPASDASSNDAAAPPDLCAHHGPPPRPEAGAGANRMFVLAVDSYTLDDSTAGFDLDGVCTCDPLGRSKGAGPPSCEGPSSASNCDGDGGVDNRLGSALATLKSVALDVGALFNQQVACGGATLLVVLSDYNGEANDIDVKLSVIESLGILDAPDGGATTDAGPGCALDGEPPTFPPRRDNTDVWNVPPGATTRTEVTGWVKDFQLVVDSRTSTSTLPFYFGRTLVTLSGAAVTGQLVPLGPDRAELKIVGGLIQGGPAASFRLSGGTLAGRAPVRQVLIGGGLLNANGTESGYVCKSVAWPLVKDQICRSADMVHNIGLDLTGQPCDAVSVGVRFEAIPALLGRELPRTVSSPCGPTWDNQSCAE